MKKKNIPWLAVFLVLVAVFGGWILMPQFFGGASGPQIANAQTLTVYKSSLCGCCTNYVSYLKRQGYDVTVVETNEMSEVKNKYGIPENMRSCHTTVINDGEQVVEGHIPVEVMQKFMQESADTRGLMMPGMPAGSPGMPGVKKGAFQIYDLNSDGETTPYMEF